MCGNYHHPLKTFSKNQNLIDGLEPKIYAKYTWENSCYLDKYWGKSICYNNFF